MCTLTLKSDLCGRAMGGPSGNRLSRSGNFMYRPKSALTAFHISAPERRVLRSPPEVPPPSTGRFRHFGLSTLALAIMPRRVLSAMGGPSSNRPGHFMYRPKSAFTALQHQEARPALPFRSTTTFYRPLPSASLLTFNTALWVWPS